ncbi:MAG: hypothetical protein FWG35_05080 [Spirochaetaceae bacterium]|nr:hypothetical protein [Spirochaetaceae bacterium]
MRERLQGSIYCEAPRRLDFFFVFRYFYRMTEDLGRIITAAREEILDTWRHL